MDSYSVCGAVALALSCVNFVLIVVGGLVVFGVVRRKVLKSTTVDEPPPTIRNLKLEVSTFELKPTERVEGTDEENARKEGQGTENGRDQHAPVVLRRSRPPSLFPKPSNNNNDVQINGGSGIYDRSQSYSRYTSIVQASSGRVEKRGLRGPSSDQRSPSEFLLPTMPIIMESDIAEDLNAAVSNFFRSDEDARRTRDRISSVFVVAESTSTIYTCAGKPIGECGTTADTKKATRFIFKVKDEEMKEIAVFVYHHDAEQKWVRLTLQPKLEEIFGMKVATVDDFVLGSAWIDETLYFIKNSEFVILVLSDDFVVDPKCREVTIIAYSSKSRSIVPVAVKLTSMTTVVNDNVYWNLIQSNGLIPWPEKANEEVLFWTQLENTLLNDSERISEVELLKAVTSRLDSQFRELRGDVLRQNESAANVDVLPVPNVGAILRRLDSTSGGSKSLLTTGEPTIDDATDTECQAHVTRVTCRAHTFNGLLDVYVIPDVLTAQHRVVAYRLNDGTEKYFDDGPLDQWGPLVCNYMRTKHYDELLVAVRFSRRTPDDVDSYASVKIQTCPKSLPEFVQRAIDDAVYRLEHRGVLDLRSKTEDEKKCH